MREKSKGIVLKPHLSGKSDVWKNFSLVFEKRHDVRDSASVEKLIELKYLCACNRCHRMYRYKASNGGSFGTKNLIDHVRQCKGGNSGVGQLKLVQCLQQKQTFSNNDLADVKRKEVAYCVDGYQSFRSVEHGGLRDLLQTFVKLGAKYGKFDVNHVICGRNVVARETLRMSLELKANLKESLKSPVADGTVALCLDLYTDDYRKKAYLDIHATWATTDFSIQHAALAVRHFGTAAHTAENIVSVVSAILDEYDIPEDTTPVTTDHGANIVAALRNSVRLDCICHSLYTVLETAWRDTKSADSDAVAYETAVSGLCRYVKQPTGVQEQLPKSLKHGGDTRPWISMYRRADAVDASYEKLVSMRTLEASITCSLHFYMTCLGVL